MMMVSVCRRMLLPVSCGMLLFGSPALGYSGTFSASLQIAVQRDTIPPDTLKKDTVIQEATPRDTAQRQAKGRVLDQEGSPLAGVTVNIRGSDVETRTDDQGAYHITSPTDTAAMLVFSLLGFDPFEMPMSIADGQTVTLQPTDASANVLEEVVVIG